MRRAVAPPIPPQLYRHFAVVTVSLTASLAMFADGESREAQAAHTAQSRPAAAPGPARFAIAEETVDESGGWGDEGDFGSDSGDDFDGGFGVAGAASFAGSASGIVPDLDGLEALGYTPEYLAELSAKERELLLKGLRESGMLTPAIRRQRSAALQAASERRSGASSGEG